MSYELKETMLLKLENDELRNRIKELKQKITEIENTSICICGNKIGGSTKKPNNFPKKRNIEI